MFRVPFARRAGWVLRAGAGAALSLFLLASSLMSVAAPARAQSTGVRATVTYIGGLGPVGNARPLCLCVYYDADLEQGLGCLVARNNGAVMQLPTDDTRDYYFIAFLDRNRDEGHDVNEPYEIYHDRGAPPADAVAAKVGYADIEITFGDEYLPGSATSTPVETPTPTPTETASATGTPTAHVCTGGCESGVSLDDVKTLVRIALGELDLGACANADADASRGIEVEEIVTAARRARLGCS